MFHKLILSNFVTLGQINANSDAEFKNILEKLGGWPVLLGDSWNEKTFEWSDISQFTKMGYSAKYFIAMSIETDSRNNSKRIISVSIRIEFKINYKTKLK